MYNLIHAEFYKWKKSKSFLVCLLSAIGIILFVYFMLNVASEVQKGKLKNGTGGIIVSGELMEEQNGDILKQIGILEMISQIISSGTNIRGMRGCQLSVEPEGKYLFVSG